MVAFIFLTLGMFLFIGGVCAALAHGVSSDSLSSDLELLWDRYPSDIRNKIRKTFE